MMRRSGVKFPRVNIQPLNLLRKPDLVLREGRGYTVRSETQCKNFGKLDFQNKYLHVIKNKNMMMYKILQYFIERF